MLAAPETSGWLVFWMVAGARFLLPLTIPRYPLPGIIASLVLDAVDQTIPTGRYYPMCGMNVALRPVVVPAFYFLLMGRDAGVDRFGDIWAGVFVKRICDHLGWAVNSGPAQVVADQRASNVWANLRKEAPGLELNETLWRAVDGERDALVVVSDHGQLPIYEMVRVNAALAKAGLVTTIGEGGRRRLAPDSPMVAISSAAVSHVYLNLEGRETGGVVTIDEAPELLRRAARVLADLELEGRPAVEKIYNRDEMSEIGLDHPSSGDLVVFFNPGFATAEGFEGPALEPSRYYGQHGFLSSHDEMCGVLFARGVGIKKKRLGEIRATEVAPMVARWLGFEF